MTATMDSYALYGSSSTPSPAATPSSALAPSVAPVAATTTTTVSGSAVPLLAKPGLWVVVILGAAYLIVHVHVAKGA